MIALSAYNLAGYLVDIVQIPRRDVPWKDVAWKDVFDLTFFQSELSRNNCFFCTDRKGVNNYFFKQSKSLSKSNARDISSEAQFYMLVAKNLKSELGAIVPEFLFYDDYNGIAVTIYHPKFQQLSSLESRIYKQAGSALKKFHATCTRQVINEMFVRDLCDEANPKQRKLKQILINDFRVYQPSLLRLTDPELKELGRRNNPYMDQLLAYLKSASSKIDCWKKDWDLETKGLIHGDATVRNFGLDNMTPKIIDFEYVSYGAWFWDLAVFVGDLLSLVSLPGVEPPRAGTPTSSIFPLIANFCEGYGISEEEEKLVLRWSGIYFLELFLTTEVFFHLQYGLALIENTEVCHKEIFTDQI